LEDFLARLAKTTAPTQGKRSKARAPKARALKRDDKPQRAATLDVRIRDGHLVLQLERAASRASGQVWAASIAVRDLEHMCVLVKTAIQTHEVRHSAAPEIAAVGAQLKRLLPAELLRRLRSLPRSSVLQFACTEGTHRIPWEWISIAKEPLCLRHAVVRRPVSLTDMARGYRLP